MRLTRMAVLAAVLLSSTLDADVVSRAIRATDEFCACKGRSASDMGDFLAALVRRDRQAALEAMRKIILVGVPAGDCIEIKEGDTFEIMTSTKDKDPLSLKGGLLAISVPNGDGRYDALYYTVGELCFEMHDGPPWPRGDKPRRALMDEDRIRQARKKLDSAADAVLGLAKGLFMLAAAIWGCWYLWPVDGCWRLSSGGSLLGSSSIRTGRSLYRRGKRIERTGSRSTLGSIGLHPCMPDGHS